MCVCTRVWVCRLNQVLGYLIDRRELGARGIFFFFFFCSCKLVLAVGVTRTEWIVIRMRG